MAVPGGLALFKVSSVTMADDLPNQAMWKPPKGLAAKTIPRIILIVFAMMLLRMSAVAIWD